jgi:hypothetical protein
MRKFTLFLAAIAASVLASSYCNPAYAQSTRTWVSGVGDDANPCSRTAPCKTFSGAILKTAAFGEINVLDPGGFGALNITKSITVSAEGVEGGVLVSGTNGITVFAGPNDVVILRGLDIVGLGTGLAGIQFNTGGALHVEKCRIYGFQSGSSGFGINFTPNSAAELFVSDTIITENGQGTAGGGIVIKPSGTAGVNAKITKTLVKNNSLGIRADGANTTGIINVAITDSESSGNTYAGITSFAGTGTTRLNIASSTSSGNGTGLNANGANATLRVGTSIVSHNNTGFAISNSATMTSFGTNQIVDNPSGAPPVAMPIFGAN